MSWRANHGDIEATKQGFYVDLDEDGTIMGNPDEIGAEQARHWIEHGRKAVEHLTNSLNSSALP